MFSDQIDVAVIDRQYSPLVFHFQGQTVVPAESVYAAFEAKQTINAALVKYAQDKAESVRKLHRTSLPIPYAEGVYPPKPLHHIVAGLLTFESEWNPPLGDSLNASLLKAPKDQQLDIGCIASHGIFLKNQDGSYDLDAEGKPATAFLLELIARLRAIATVPMIDVRAYASWLNV